jgi:lipopolysaccharide transport protein LptA
VGLEKLFSLVFIYIFKVKYVARVLICLLFSAHAYAQQTVNVQPSGPVRVNANNMQYFGAENRARFVGNVVASNEQFTLTADRVDVFFNDNNEVVRIVCNGNVNFKSEDIVAVANSAELDQSTKTIRMRGNVKVWQRENYLEGEYIDLQYETREILVQRGETERVTVIFTPSEN